MPQGLWLNWIAVLQVGSVFFLSYPDFQHQDFRGLFEQPSIKKYFGLFPCEAQLSGFSEIIPSYQCKQMVGPVSSLLWQMRPTRCKSDSYKTEKGSPSGAPRVDGCGSENELLRFKLCKWNSESQSTGVQILLECQIWSSSSNAFSGDRVKKFGQSDTTP